MYTINTADTWEKKTMTFPADTTGTWGTGNGRGILVRWSLGAGSGRLGTANQWNGSQAHGATGTTNLFATNAATFQITGLQLEAGSVATDFEHRSFAQEFALCQRYFQKNATAQMYLTLVRTADNQHRLNLNLPVTMRATPTGTITSADQDGGPSLTIEAGSSAHTIKVRQGPAVNTGSAPNVSEYTVDAEL